MRDYLTLGPTPADEECAQLGAPEYAARARAECARFIALLGRKFSPPPPGVEFRILPQRHDFGTYYEAAVHFDAADAAQIAYAYAVEENLPRHWEDSAPVDWQREAGLAAA
jgi:hypothetical protein